MLYHSTLFWQGSISSLLIFSVTHYVLSRLISHEDQRQHWKRVNISTSFIHSILSSILSIYCFIENPRMCTTDIISSFTSNAYLFISFEIGYFVFDAIDMLIKSPNRQTYEILLHHIIIVVCFGIAVTSGRYIGYAILSLFLEINSIFLHLRQLFLFWNVSKKATIYRINTGLNLITFLVFRFGLVAYMSIWLVRNRSYVPLVFCAVGQSGLFLLTIMNLNLLARFLRSDLMSKT